MGDDRLSDEALGLALFGVALRQRLAGTRLPPNAAIRLRWDAMTDAERERYRRQAAHVAAAVRAEEAGRVARLVRYVRAADAVQAARRALWDIDVPELAVIGGAKGALWAAEDERADARAAIPPGDLDDPPDDGAGEAGRVGRLQRLARAQAPYVRECNRQQDAALDAAERGCDRHGDLDDPA